MGDQWEMVNSTQNCCLPTYHVSYPPWTLSFITSNYTILRTATLQCFHNRNAFATEHCLPLTLPIRRARLCWSARLTHYPSGTIVSPAPHNLAVAIFIIRRMQLINTNQCLKNMRCVTHSSTLRPYRKQEKSFRALERPIWARFPEHLIATVRTARRWRQPWSNCSKSIVVI